MKKKTGFAVHPENIGGVTGHGFREHPENRNNGEHNKKSKLITLHIKEFLDMPYVDVPLEVHKNLAKLHEAGKLDLNKMTLYQVYALNFIVKDMENGGGMVLERNDGKLKEILQIEDPKQIIPDQQGKKADMDKKYARRMAEETGESAETVQ